MLCGYYTKLNIILYSMIFDNVNKNEIQVLL